MSRGKFALLSLGCKVNQYEEEKISSSLVSLGLERVSFDERADLYIVNSCSVTSTAEAKSRSFLSRARRTNPAARIVLAGCYASSLERAGRLPHADAPDMADLMISQADKGRLASIIGPRLDEWGFASEEGSSSKGNSVSTGRSAAGEIRRAGLNTRRFVKVQDGCDCSCSYCIVPSLRGASNSRAVDEVLAELSILEETGVPECVLTGIHLGHYFDKSSGTDLAGLLERVLKETRNMRIRLSSIEPSEVSERLVALVSSERRIARHLHIPLQSGSDRILELMNRGYSGREWLELASTLVARIEGLAIATDVIVGFPTEDEAAFEETRAILERAPVYDMHIFRYSKRPGTAAAAMPSHVDEKVKKERASILSGIRARKLELFHRRSIGETVELLIERARSGCLTGHTDNYIEVVIEEAESSFVGSIVAARLLEDRGEFMTGELMTGQLITDELMTGEFTKR
jgi:threonylcarbamoyladenosine tRNA methylthiotransferase MtaB